jgi:hypothetical protein
VSLPYPAFEVELTKAGEVFQPRQVQALLDGLASGPVTDVFVVAHGWNNDVADARSLYEKLFARVKAVEDADLVRDTVARTPAILAVLWPSKKFTDEELIPGGGASLAGARRVKAVAKVLERLKEDPERLGRKGADRARAALLKQAQALVPDLETDAGARREYVRLLRKVLGKKSAHADDGSDAFFAVAPETLFEDLAAPVAAPAAPASSLRGGAAAVRGRGGAAGLEDAFSGFLGAARRLANFATYYQMKERAGTVGTKGLAPILRKARKAVPGLRLHLIGHSFGGRVVTAAALALDPGTTGVTMTLLQAAYSHNGLAEKFDGEHDGFFRRVISEKRIAGPIVITHTKNDKAVGVAYPLASRISREKAAALGDADDPYGGMGRNGAQRTAEVVKATGTLLDLGEVEATPYGFREGKVYNLDADRVIRDHSDIAKDEVAAALWSAVVACKA